MSNQDVRQINAAEQITEQEKVIALFQFIKELNRLQQNAILNVKDYPWYCFLADIPCDPENIAIFYRDRVEDEDIDSDSDSVLLAVHKPEFKNCPQPNPSFSPWLKSGWDDYRSTASVVDELKIPTAEKAAQTEHFEDNAERVQGYRRWLKARSRWVERQELTAKTRKLFNDLYSHYFSLQRDAETWEMTVANGLLFDREKPQLQHPVLTHRVKLDYDAEKDTIFIEDTGVASELYSLALQALDDVNLMTVNSLRDDLQQHDYHPLDRNDTPNFLKALVHQLSSDSLFTEDSVPADWSKNNRLLLADRPCFILRKRLDGTVKVIEQIIENILETGQIPAAISDIVSGGTIDIPEDIGVETLEERLAGVGGESIDILLSKEANREQLEIAKRIEYYNAVLVQGPPGTGKTHTIANLMGHFLAHGQSVLVTSHTTKALSVLKDMVDPGLQHLCVSVLDDSHLDMERSIDGITDYISKTTSFELKREMDDLAAERAQVIKDLDAVRRQIFAVIDQECSSIVYDGEDISPAQAAEFVFQNEQILDYIPGTVRPGCPLPLTPAQLSDLYRSNVDISAADEQELACDIPASNQLLSPEDFAQLQDAHDEAGQRLKDIEQIDGWQVVNYPRRRQLSFTCHQGTFSVDYPQREVISALKEQLTSWRPVERWMQAAMVDGKSGGAFRQRWLTLIQQIENTCAYAESIVTEQFGRQICLADQQDLPSLRKPLEKLKQFFNENGKTSKFTLRRNKDYAAPLESVTINGQPLASAADCDIILHCLEADAMRKQCAVYWDDLFSDYDVPAFEELDAQTPERAAANWIPTIQKYLNWYDQDYQQLMAAVEDCGFPATQVFASNALDVDLVKIEKIFTAAQTTLPRLCQTCEAALDMEDAAVELSKLQAVLSQGQRGSSAHCLKLAKAIDDGDTAAYGAAYASLMSLYHKYSLQNTRQELLKTLGEVAPAWAEAIRDREGLHGQDTVPDTIDAAWKWKQLSGTVDSIISQPFPTLQADSRRLSREYRSITARYAEKSGWYHLLRRTEADIDMRHDLQGWMQTVKNIGKGTGKNAPRLRAKARELMARCQTAVPGWIMPTNRALESLDPRQNRFDIIIIDEASQSDLSALAILYMGRKLIIVGDDKQVSPMAIGLEIDKMNALEQMYIRDKIPNSHLYNAKTSIYDIAATTFQPLMLREHFRCVPEIIGFSNMLSYDYKIKPLRDAGSSSLLPAVVSYRVEDGLRGASKTNRQEARTIVALMKACLEQPEYAGKSMGIISLLGDEQVKIIQTMLEEEIAPQELISRSLLCGNSASFQGDERDVIFLSLVDSGDGAGPLRLQNYGVDDALRKRYNVASSRARDQLWVVHSLDAATDLKQGDIRKMLLDYAADPAAAIKEPDIQQQAYSPFEAAVASALTGCGYHLVQQWPVGAYRLNMVAVYGKQTVAIECDGERWHSGEARVRESMERQTILERLGWRFIRIRGSEYYRHPEDTLQRVISELHSYGIEPEADSFTAASSRSSELLKRVKGRAWQLLQEADGIKTPGNRENTQEARSPGQHPASTATKAADATSATTGAGKDPYVLLTNTNKYYGKTPALALAKLCEKLARQRPDEMKSIIDKKHNDCGSIVLFSSLPPSEGIRLGNLKAYIKSDLSEDTVILYGKWLCKICQVPESPDTPDAFKMPRPFPAEKRSII